MKKMIAAVLLFVMVFCAVCPAAAETSSQRQYEEAQQYLSVKEYNKAKEVFSSLGTFQEAQKYVVYITALQEADMGLYGLAAVNFNALGDFLGSSLMAS